MCGNWSSNLSRNNERMGESLPGDGRRRGTRTSAVPPGQSRQTVNHHGLGRSLWNVQITEWGLPNFNSLEAFVLGGAVRRVQKYGFDGNG